MRVCSVCRRCYDDSVSFCSNASHPELSEAGLPNPEMIAGYRLEHLLESGGAGDIYRASEITSGRTCLVRIFSATEDADDVMRDAKLAATLFHPNIVDTYDAGVLDTGDYYVIQEDPDGRTMREFLSDVGMPELLRSIEIVRQIAEALHALHLSGLKHGAIRPENIVLTSERERGLMVRIQNPDLGGAIARSIIADKFRADSALDQIKYFSPEQCAGAETGPQTDVYSLGIVFYELLTGAPPFDDAKAVGLIQKHKSQPVPDIRINNFHLRMLVTHSLTEALQKQPRLRQSSANVFARQLRHIEQLATHVATPPPAGVAPAWRPLPATPVSASIIPSSDSVDPLPPSDAPRQTWVETNKNNAGEGSIPGRIESEPPPPIEIEGAVGSNDRTIQAVEIDDRGADAPSSASEPTPLSDPTHPEPDLPPNIWTRKLESIAARLKSEKPTAQLTSIFDADDRKILETRPLGLAEPQADSVEIRVQRTPAFPKMIDWNTPEGDIPADAVFLRVLTKDGARESEVTSAVPEKTIQAPAPALTETEVDPAPGVLRVEGYGEEGQFVERLRDEKAFEAPVWIDTPMVVEAVATTEAPVVFENSAPVESAIEVKTPVIVDDSGQREVGPVPEPTIEIQGSKGPAGKGAPTRLLDAIPQAKQPEPAVAGSASNVQVPVVPSVNSKAKPRKTAPNRSGLGFPVNLADLEEITIVTPPTRRIRVELQRAAALSSRPSSSNVQPPSTATDTAFSPTILGAKPVSAVEGTNRNDEMFSTIELAPGATVLGRYQSALLGVGIAGLIGLFLFGFGSATRYFETSSGADSMPPAQAAENASALPVAEIPISAKKTTPKNSVKPVTETKAELKPETKPVVGELSTGKSLPEKKSGAGKRLDPKAKPDTAKAVKATPASTTGKRPAKAAPQKVTVAKTTTIPRKGKEATRPRIVRNAKP